MVTFEEEPEFDDLMRRLLSIDGESVENVETGMLPTVLSSKLLKEGEDLTGRNVEILEGGVEGGCLDNTIEIFCDNPKGYKPYVGYALVEGVWLEHFWAVDKQGNIIETCPVKDRHFEKYFGKPVPKEHYRTWCR